MKNDSLRYLDRLDDPFLFLEERFVTSQPGKRKITPNTLPKVVFVLEGSMVVDFENAGSAILRPGSVLVNFRHLQQVYRSSDDSRPGRMRVLRLTFPWEAFEAKKILIPGGAEFASFLSAHLPPYGALTLPGHVPWDRWLHDAREQLSSRNRDRRYRAHASLRLVLLELVQNWKNKNQPGKTEAGASRRLLNRIDHHIEEHLDEPLSLADIASSVDRSEEHISRFYRQQRGTALFDEIRRLRLERAKYFLLCTDLSITRIAEKSGFATLAHFSRTFRQSYGKSPLQFREQP